MPAASFYEPLADDRFRATEHTGGPWDPALQHAGPPSALLARAVERLAAPWPATVVRMSVDILGPVPVAELSLSTAVLRSGRSVELVTAELAHAGRPAIRATAWRVRADDLELPPLPATAVGGGDPVPAFPAAESELPGDWQPGGYLAAMQWRVAAGSWADPGPATVWGRLRVPLLPDEPPTGLQRLMAIADSGNGVSTVLPVQGWFFINPDLTVHVEAPPQGEWICIDATTVVQPAGYGLASSRLFDRDRLVARGAQSLYVGTR